MSRGWAISAHINHVNEAQGAVLDGKASRQGRYSRPITGVRQPETTLSSAR